MPSKLLTPRSYLDPAKLLPSKTSSFGAPMIEQRGGDIVDLTGTIADTAIR